MPKVCVPGNPTTDARGRSRRPAAGANRAPARAHPGGRCGPGRPYGQCPFASETSGSGGGPSKIVRTQDWIASISAVSRCAG